MAEISKITLPSGTTYDLKDETARSLISGGVTFIVAWDGASTPVVGNIPAGVTVTYNGTDYTGTLAANSAQAGAFYLVKESSTTNDIYAEYVPVGEVDSKTWEKLGDTKADLSNCVSDVTLNKQTTNFVTGYASPIKTKAIGQNSTFSSSNPTVTLSDAGVSGGDVPFLKSASLSTENLVTTTVLGVQNSTTTASKATAATSQTTATGAGTSSSTNTDWLKGVSVSNETLTIGAATMDTQTTTQWTMANVTVPIKNTSATTVATGLTSLSGSGAAVGKAITMSMGTMQATAVAGTVTWGNKDTFDAITGLGSPTTSAGLNNSTSLTVTKNA